ncbi:uncharacterized protein [Panulirus ornatus]|uniref:uncharacterized protein n=1 Tax=Panulirus ornatus TaxID=150431 RepID=UPI003A852676
MNEAHLVPFPRQTCSRTDVPAEILGLDNPGRRTRLLHRRPIEVSSSLPSSWTELPGALQNILRVPGQKRGRESMGGGGSTKCVAVAGVMLMMATLTLPTSGVITYDTFKKVSLSQPDTMFYAEINTEPIKLQVGLKTTCAILCFNDPDCDRFCIEGDECLMYMRSLFDLSINFDSFTCYEREPRACTMDY